MDKKSMLLNVIKGSLVSLIITIILIIGLTVFMMFKELSGGTVNITMIVFTGIAIAIGAILATKKNGEKGWLVGLLVSILYFIVVYIISSALNGFVFKQYDLVRFVMAMVVGLVSGILGINL